MKSQVFQPTEKIKLKLKVGEKQQFLCLLGLLVKLLAYFFMGPTCFASKVVMIIGLLTYDVTYKLR